MSPILLGQVQSRRDGAIVRKKEFDLLKQCGACNGVSL
jgi:hypothetical protein